MTLYLGREVIDGVVDDTALTYLGTCDFGDDCRYFAENRRQEVVEDALDGHRRRAHATTTTRTEDTSRTGWMPAVDRNGEPSPPLWSYGPIADTDAAEPSKTPPWAPSPTRREGDPT